MILQHSFPWYGSNKRCIFLFSFSWRYFSVEHISYTLETRVLSVTHFQLFGKKDLQLVYLSVFDFLRNTVVLTKSLLRTNSISKNAILFSFSISIVNFILLRKLFNESRTWLIQLEFTKEVVSSTYLFHNNISLDYVGIIFCSSSTIKTFAKTGPTGDPIATSSVCTYVLLFRVKCAILVQRYNDSFISCSGMLVLISFLSYILLVIILIVS